MPTMPNVVGLGLSQATTSLIQAGVTPDNALLPITGYTALGYFDKWTVTLSWVKAQGVQPGNITAQFPASGATVNFRDPVTLTVSNFPMAVADRYSGGGYT